MISDLPGSEIAGFARFGGHVEILAAIIQAGARFSECVEKIQLSDSEVGQKAVLLRGLYWHTNSQNSRMAHSAENLLFQRFTAQG